VYTPNCWTVVEASASRADQVVGAGTVTEDAQVRRLVGPSHQVGDTLPIGGWSSRAEWMGVDDSKGNNSSIVF